MSWRAATSVGVLLLLIPTATWAGGVSLRLCTGPVDGNYYAAGEEIKRQVARHNLDVQLIDTAGSIENMERMAGDECDAGVAQIDAYLQYQAMHPDTRLAVEWPRHLYEEYLHLVCRRDAGDGTMTDLSDAGADTSLVVGAPGSGSAITWDSITRLRSDYLDVKTLEADNAAALRAVTEGKTSCFMVVSGLSSSYLQTVDDAGGQLRLLAVNDQAILEARHFNKPIYSFQQIPKDTYPGLQGPTGAPVQTLAVGAVLLTSSAWAGQQTVGFDTLIDGIKRAAPIIRSRVVAK